MSEQIERRVADRDPVEVLTPEVFALLRLCGGLRSSDVQEQPRGPRRAGPSERRGDDRRHQERGRDRRSSFAPDDGLSF